MTTASQDSRPERRGGVARWRDILQTLEAEIATGQPARGERLPTEAQVAARFGVNRHTARRAVDELARAGLVRVEHGRGAFVSEDVIDYEVAPRTRFSEWIRRHNREPSGRVLQLRELPADAEVAANLGLAEGDGVVLMERLGAADGVPVSLAAHYFPLERLPGMAAALASSSTITEALAAVGVPDYVRQSTRVSARMPSAAEARLLQLARTRPLLVCENLNVDRLGRIVEYGVALHPSPRVQVVFEP